MPAPIAIELSADEVDTLQKNLCSGKTPVRLRERSEIVLLASAGLPNYKIAQRMGTARRAGLKILHFGFSSPMKPFIFSRLD